MEFTRWRSAMLGGNKHIRHSRLSKSGWLDASRAESRAASAQATSSMRSAPATCPAWLILEGSADAIRRSAAGSRPLVATYGPGQFTGETNQFSGHATLASVVAGEKGVIAIPFDAPHLRALVIGSADVGETIMRAYILRRVSLIEEGRTGGAGSILVGRRDAPDIVGLSGFLTRNGYPHTLIAACEAEGRELVERLGIAPDDLPLMICPNGTLLRNPSNADAASCLGIMPDLDAKKVYDVAVIGAGPSGLATAVYGASEGLSVLVLGFPRFRRPGGRIRPDRKLSRLPDWYLRAGSCRPCLQSGDEIRRRARDPADRRKALLSWRVRKPRSALSSAMVVPHERVPS